MNARKRPIYTLQLIARDEAPRQRAPTIRTVFTRVDLGPDCRTIGVHDADGLLDALEHGGVVHASVISVDLLEAMIAALDQRDAQRRLIVGFDAVAEAQALAEYARFYAVHGGNRLDYRPEDVAEMNATLRATIEDRLVDTPQVCFIAWPARRR